MNPIYPVYVISKGRWKSRLTVKALERMRVPYRIVIEPQEYEHYAAVIDPAKILRLPFSNLGKGSIPARNWVWAHAVETGAARHWILDDNIQGFYRLNRNTKIQVRTGATFRAAEEFVGRYENIALAGFHYTMFAPRRSKWPAFLVNRRIYSCILIKNDIPYRWRGRYNEDKLNNVVQQHLGSFSTTYQEISPSGTGIHAICAGTVAEDLRSTHVPDAPDGMNVEIYSEKRFFTYTGLCWNQTLEITDQQRNIDTLNAFVLMKTKGKKPRASGKSKSGNGTVSLDQADESEELRPFSRKDIIRNHENNLVALRCTREGAGQGNALLNHAAFWAGRAHAAVKSSEKPILDLTYDQLEKELLHIVTEEWTHRYPESGARAVIHDAWESGIAKQPPLNVMVIPEDARFLTTNDEARAWYNERFTVIENYGGKCLVFWQEPDPNPAFKGRIIPGTQSQQEFVKRHDHLIVSVLNKDGEAVLDKKGNPLRLSTVECWLGYRWREQCKAVVFAPGQSLKPDIKNLWTGFTVLARPGNATPFLDFVKEVICSGNEEHYRWVINWCAYAVQNPGERGHVALVLRGKKGTGKSFFAEAFGHLWGSHFLPLINADHVAGKFNVHLRTCSVLFANEALFAGNHQHESVLKALITDAQIPIEAKFVDTVMAPNFTHIIIAGNADWLVRATEDERRFMMLDVSGTHKEDTAYFGKLDEWLNKGGYEVLLHHLLHLDLTDFNPRQAIRTSALSDQILASMDNATEQAWLECLYSGRLPSRKMRPDGSVELRADRFVKWAQERNSKGQVNEMTLGHLLGESPRAREGHKPMGFKIERPVKNGPRVRVIPKLAEARDLWDQRRGKINWPRTSGQQDLEEAWELFD